MRDKLSILLIGQKGAVDLNSFCAIASSMCDGNK